MNFINLSSVSIGSSSILIATSVVVFIVFLLTVNVVLESFRES